MPVKKLLAALAGILGIAWLRRRAVPSPPVAPGPDPAEELRAKLAEQREPEPAAGPEAPQDVAARRSEVHDRARQAMDDLSTPEG